MKKFAVIGDPIAHSLSPELHQDIFNQADLEGTYEAVRVPADSLAQVVESFKSGEWDGLNVTLPHKATIIPYLDQLSDDAQQIGAVNCIVRDEDRLTGHNTDWVGFTRILEILEQDEDLSRRSWFVLGAGGNARSITYALLQKKVNSITLINRTESRSQAIVKDFSKLAADNEANLEAIPLRGIDMSNFGSGVVINCTSLGMTPAIQAIPVPEMMVTPDQILIDTIYAPRRTRFLRYGHYKGAITMNGMGMFIYQGIKAEEIWWDRSLSEAIDIPTLAQRLEEYLA